MPGESRTALTCYRVCMDKQHAMSRKNDLSQLDLCALAVSRELGI